jgi:hypothetical protein
MKPKLKDVLAMYAKSDKSKESKELMINKLKSLYSGKPIISSLEDDRKYNLLNSLIDRLKRMCTY